jgi:hypothetical protein
MKFQGNFIFAKAAHFGKIGLQQVSSPSFILTFFSG